MNSRLVKYFQEFIPFWSDFFGSFLVRYFKIRDSLYTQLMKTAKAFCQIELLIALILAAGSCFFIIRCQTDIWRRLYETRKATVQLLTTWNEEEKASLLTKKLSQKLMKGMGLLSVIISLSLFSGLSLFLLKSYQGILENNQAQHQFLKDQQQMRLLVAGLRELVHQASDWQVQGNILTLIAGKESVKYFREKTLRFHPDHTPIWSLYRKFQGKLKEEWAPDVRQFDVHPGGFSSPDTRLARQLIAIALQVGDFSWQIFLTH